MSLLLGGRSGQLCSMPCRVRGAVVPWAGRSVGIPSCPAPPRPAAPPWAAPNRGMSGFWIRQLSCRNKYIVERPAESKTLAKHQPFPKAANQNVFLFTACRTHNQDISWSGRAAHDGAAGWELTNRFAQELTIPVAVQIGEGNPPGRLPGSTNNRIPM